MNPTRPFVVPLVQSWTHRLQVRRERMDEAAASKADGVSLLRLAAATLIALFALGAAGSLLAGT